MINVLAIPAFADNYFWLIHDGKTAAVVDPGDATPVLIALDELDLELGTILITHHHFDHIGGVTELVEVTGAEVYGPADEKKAIPTIKHPLTDGDVVELPALDELRFEVMAVPGHTLGHIAYYNEQQGWLFCGDTLFAAGCGRLFEGTPKQMLESLSRLAALPGNTAVFCAHEYTLSNLAFAAAVEPNNQAINEAISRNKALRERDEPTVPSRIEVERRINPFLRSAQPSVAQAAARRIDGLDPADSLAVFTAIRRWKDDFRAPTQ